MALRDRLFATSATATLATVATLPPPLGPTVARIATVAVASPAKPSPTPRSEAELLALVERVALAYRAPPGELAEMKRLALADPEAAWSAFLATARTEGIH